MFMIATSEVTNSKQDFQCLRCGHQESRRSEAMSKPISAAG
jgi:transcription elongation factor Elf1